jgi:UDP-N-acetylmuramoyl-L-alanyl-D-glutamate--2,6-diaminopimelate ligase
MRLKTFIRSLVPKWLLNRYHFKQSVLAAIIYGFPAKRLIIIGVTGTKGKTTTSAMIWYLLQAAGHKAGLISTAQISIGAETKLNDLKMTMPSPFVLQRLLRRMVKVGCKYAVVETSSEGLAQWRHLGINYDVAVFTNLDPEHLETHGSYENYRAAKGKLFKVLVKSKIKKIPTLAAVIKTSIINIDDRESAYFLQFPVARKIGFTIEGKVVPNLATVYSADIKDVTPHHSSFTVNNKEVFLPVGGNFNIANATAALAVVATLGVPLARAASSLADFPGTPGRLEFVIAKPFSVVVDYAHTPESLEAVYETLKGTDGHLLAVLGSCGGGRDKAKREVLGRLAGKYADLVFVTNEDPYDEDPHIIIGAVARGARTAGKKDGENLWVNLDRREAIAQALKMAKPGDTVVITGKGAEQWLCVAGGKKIPWDDRRVMREEFDKLNSETNL